MIFDSHCHYNLEPLAQNWQHHWQQAQDKDVQKSVVIGTSIETSQLAIKIANSEKNLWAAVAIHPIEYNDPQTETNESLENLVKTNLQQIEELLSAHSKIVAIGETGLDYFHLQSFPEEAKQKIVMAQKTSLRQHIEVAQHHQLSLILHVRDVTEQAYWDTLQILEEKNYQGKFVLHCVSGPTAYVHKALQMGAYLGAAGNVTYKNAEHLRDLVRFAPPERILLETDAPYLPPQAYRGQTCEPWMISQTAAFLEQELTLSPQVTWQNADTFFNL